MIRFVSLFACLLSTLQAMELPIPMRDRVPIEIESGFWGMRFKQEGKLIHPVSVNEVVGKYPECSADISSAKSFASAGTVFAAAGGGLIGFSVGPMITGGDFNAPLFYSGLGSVVLAFIVGGISTNKLGHAIKAYNAMLGKSSLQLNLTPTHQGLAIHSSF